MATKMKEITVRVSQTHINNGEQLDEQNCAIALALKDRLKDRMTLARSVFVNTDRISLEGDALLPSYEWRKMPKAIKTFIYGFDNDRVNVKPFFFKMKVPQAWTK